MLILHHHVTFSYQGPINPRWRGRLSGICFRHAWPAASEMAPAPSPLPWFRYTAIGCVRGMSAAAPFFMCEESNSRESRKRRSDRRRLQHLHTARRTYCANIMQAHASCVCSDLIDLSCVLLLRSFSLFIHRDCGITLAGSCLSVFAPDGKSLTCCAGGFGCPPAGRRFGAPRQAGGLFVAASNEWDRRVATLLGRSGAKRIACAQTFDVLQRFANGEVGKRDAGL